MTDSVDVLITAERVPSYAHAGDAGADLHASESVVLAPVPSSPPGGAAAVNVSMRPNASQSYAAAVADLERVLAEGRGKLDSTTVKIIEKNLAAIDRAIAEAQRALDADSGNLYLNTHLAETMRRKLDLLRQAAALVPVS